VVYLPFDAKCTKICFKLAIKMLKKRNMSKKLFLVLIVSSLYFHVQAQKTIFISDFDDTYKITNVKNPASALYNLFFSEKDFEGNDSLYAFMQNHDSLIFVSNSPGFRRGKIRKQLQNDKISRFSLITKPKGEKGFKHKTESILKIMNQNPKAQFILIGDNGQADEKVYAYVKKQKPQQVKYIFIHMVKQKKELKGIIYYQKVNEIKKIIESHSLGNF